MNGLISSKNEALLTGAWLAAMQVALSFSLLYSAGMSPLIFLALVLAWLLGSACGVLAGNSKHAIALQAASLVLFASAEYLLLNMTFSTSSTGMGLFAGFVSGAYAGAFFRDRTERFSSIASLLLWENNGFLLGYVCASLMLFSSISVVAIAALILGMLTLSLRFLVDRKQSKTA